MTAIEAQHAGRRYGRSWALRDCTLSVPTGRVVALVGPNGAGKSTLLNMAVGLTDATSGRIAVLDGLAPGSPAALDRIAFVAQDVPLYPYLSVAETLRLVGSLASRWDEADARRRLGALNIPLDRKVGKLSGGQHAQVALAVALGRHPELLILDEPVASLDPLARHDFMAALMASVAEDGMSVVLSSHVVAELEKVCDYLIVLAAGRVQVAGDVDTLLASHHVLTGPTAELDTLTSSLDVVITQRADRQSTALVRAPQLVPPPGWRIDRTNLEELVLSYLRVPEATALPGPTTDLQTVTA
jgi:ABC-2 type transport system ATP-binding protein